MHIPSLGLYARVPTAHSLLRNPPKLRRTEWAVGTHTCIDSQKESAKLHIARISPHDPINFASFRFRYCPQFTNPARAPVKQS